MGWSFNGIRQNPEIILYSGLNPENSEIVNL